MLTHTKHEPSMLCFWYTNTDWNVVKYERDVFPDSTQFESLQGILEYLPLPAAFKKAGSFLRAQIKNSTEDIEKTQLLKKLYQLAFVHSMMLPYSETLKLPGFNVMARIPGGILFEKVPNYSQVGFDSLTLLSKTDTKTLTIYFGEPIQHRSMHELYHEIWVKSEKLFKKEYDQHIKQLYSSLQCS